MAGPDTAPSARTLIQSARRDVAAVDAQAAARDRRARRLYLAGLVLALMLSAAAAVISVRSSTTRAEDVASRIAPLVTAEQIRDARAQRAVNARAVLAGANSALARRGLPAIADPGPDATAEQLTTAASTAQVFALLPEPIAKQIRDEDRGPSITLPPPGPTAAPDAGGRQGGGVGAGQDPAGSSSSSTEPTSGRGSSSGGPPGGGGGGGAAQPSPAQPDPQGPAPQTAVPRQLLPVLPLPLRLRVLLS